VPFAPAYNQDGIVIFCEDCAMVLPFLPRFDLLLTDPPYGIGENSKRNASRGTSSEIWKRGKSRDYGDFNWDDEPISNELLQGMIGLCENAIVFGGNYYPLQPASCWLVWDKENTGDFADGEMAWTNMHKAMRIIRHQWNGFIRVGHEDRYHPTQKPCAVIAWCIDQAGTPRTILDPFMGSGTTLIAARNKGIAAVGIERERKYVDAAIARLAQQTLFAPEPAKIADAQIEIQL
jgi:DNA modification methylase